MQPEAHKSFKYLDFLNMFFLTIFLLAFVFVHKVVSVYGISVSIATTVVPIIFFTLNIIAEVYGYKYANKAIWMAVFCRFIFALIAYIFAFFPSHVVQANYDGAFSLIFSQSFRVFFGCTGGFLLGIFINIYLISKWKIILNGRSFLLRCFGSSIIGQIIFTIASVFLVFFDTLPLKDVTQIAIMSSLFKIIFSILSITPFIILVILLKKSEEINHDISIKYNPFKIS